MDSSDYKKIWTPLYLIKNLVDLHDYELENRETMGPIIYFFGGKSPSRHKQSFFI